ncbi:Oligoribonuclease, mitochondrial [Holothuria leucospilota]|uniref:Oligoribonuclease, mitochondrial n=1 Tax=Holothuria leucospilota TaxID=206669 RepID=A0A9Q1C8Y1_HOLLE|nr:Oligoribonuclease, mitochondrial [Holothuria leucospilota]
MLSRIIYRGFGKLLTLSKHPMYLSPVFQGNSASISTNSDWETTVPTMSKYYSNNSNGIEEHNKLKKRLVWVDLEMTGLDPNTCHILEMACLITDEELNIVAEGPNLIINQPEEVLNEMNEWCKKHHGESGLTKAVRESKVNLQQAEFEMLSFVRQHTAPGYCPLAGNSVHVDKVFLEKYMQQFMHHLHYRIVDVSTLKELCRRWYPEEFANCPQKKAAHRAMDDINESIKELQYYRRSIFK